MNWRLLAVIAFATLVVALMVFGGEFRVETLREVVAAAGPWGPPLFVLSFAVLEGLGCPGIFFILASTAIWPTGFAVFLNWAGAASTCLWPYPRR